MGRTDNYQCTNCGLQFRTIGGTRWHPKCVNGCEEGYVYEIWNCDICKKDFQFGDPGFGGVVANPDSSRGCFHEVILDEKLYTIELKQWCTCLTCCRKLLAEGKGKAVPPKTCTKCNKDYMDAHGWDGDRVAEDGTCYGGYGSTQFDMSCHKFRFPSGWYCYPCLDAEVKEGRAPEV